MNGVTGRMGTEPAPAPLHPRHHAAGRRADSARARPSCPSPILVGRNAGQARSHLAECGGLPLHHQSRRGAGRSRILRSTSTRRPPTAAPRTSARRSPRASISTARSRPPTTPRRRPRPLPRGAEGRREARRRAGQALAARPAEAEDPDATRLLRQDPLPSAASSATGSSRAIPSPPSAPPGTIARKMAAASSSTCSATGATCSTTCSAT